jgi:exonuclease III
MKIATFNVNGITGRLPVLLRWLEEAEPDVVCLQELKTSDDRFPAAAIEAAGYGAVWHGQRSWNGVAILAKGVEPIETRRAQDALASGFATIELHHARGRDPAVWCRPSTMPPKAGWNTLGTFKLTHCRTRPRVDTGAKPMP